MDIFIKSFLTCEEVERLNNGNFTLHNVHARITVDNLPHKLDRTKLMCLIEVNTEVDKVLTISIDDPDGEPYGKPTDIMIKGKGHRYDACYILTLKMSVEKDGYYTFVARVDDKVVAFWNFGVELKGEGKNE
ncbi:DUF6941 family protein [Brevibacillus borstelensis]|uniref:DUF6941 family protein n=1 Tax=Brevibacillus borstelensis TaxID=45462 RepID=UPI0004F3C1B3|nr:hypothetical protein [Brevibacillus borstelensis]KKX54199.1 hypothetical protein X546_17775 [Brevibacillus borstelensis cifa_chp40]